MDLKPETPTGFQPLDSGLTSLAGLTYASAAFIKMTGANTFVLRTIAQTKSDLSLNTSDSPTFVGLTLSGLTQGSVVFAGASGALSQDNSNLFWDDINKRLGIGTTTPSYILDIDAGEIGDGNYNGLRIVDTGWKAVSHPMLDFYNSNAQFGGGGSLARIYGEIGLYGTNSKLYFAVADSSKNLQDRLVIDKDGNVNIVTGNLTVSTIAAEGSDVDKFLVDSSGLIKYRTGANVLSDIGASASGHTHDHGAITGLTDDDHTQYLLADGSRNLAGAWNMGSQVLTNVNIDSGVITGITDLAIGDGGTGQGTAQNAINALSAVSGATNEHVLTKDTGTGNAVFKVSPGGSDEKVKIDAAATAGYLGAASSDGVLRVSGGLSYTDGGDLVTIGCNNPVDRGDPAANDYDLTAFNTDGNWYDWNLAGEVPAGATWVLLYISWQTDASQQRIQVRKNGNSNAIALSVARTQVANVRIDYDVWVPVDSNRVIEYNITNGTTFVGANIAVVKGWILG